MAKRKARPHNILITGATDGIGLVLAKAYASRGHHVLATGRRRLEGDEDFFGTRNIIYIQADQSQADHACNRIAHAMNKLGWEQLDLLILNAAAGWTGLPQDETSHSVSHQISVNFTAPILIAKTVAPMLFNAGGKLVLVGSTAVKKAQPAFATYAATKAGLDGFARSLHEEWKGRAQVQIVHPGPTRTAMHKKAGMKTGLFRLFFMSPRRAARGIQRAIRSGDKRRIITRGYGFGALFSRAREGEL